MIGALKEKVTLLHPVRTPDGGGGAEIAYEPRAELHAAAEDLRSSLQRLGGQETGLVRRRFTLRRRSDVLFESRLAHEGRIFRITSIERAAGQKPYDSLLCEEVR